MHETPVQRNVPAPDPGEGPQRRSFLTWVAAILGGVAGVMIALPLLGYVFGALRKREITWVKLGPVGQFPLNVTRYVTFVNPLSQPWDGITANTGVFARYLGKDANQQDQFMVLAQDCAHLGCPVHWFPASGLFMCPCHGGVYYENGERASGPPPRGMFACVWQVRDGVLEIQAPHLPTLQDTLTHPAL